MSTPAPTLPAGGLPAATQGREEGAECESQATLGPLPPSTPGHAGRSLLQRPALPSACQCVCLSVQQRKYSLHYHIALVVNYLGHCVSVAALTVAFLLFLALR